MASREHGLVGRLIEVMGTEGVERRVAQRRLFAEDALGRRGAVAASALPLAVVRPENAEAVARVLALASEAGVAVVPYGAGTGLMGGARSLALGIVLDTVKLNRIEVLAADRVVWAGSGALLGDVDTALREHGLCLGHDPWTFPVATVGGALSTNGLGYKGGRYGGMGDQAIALEVALADGSVMRTRAVTRRSAGPDLSRLFIGAEGTLGVITAAALRTYPAPELEALRAYRFQTFEEGFAAIDAISALGLRPSLLDYGEEHASPWPELTSREEEPPVLYLGFEGYAEEVEAALGRAQALVEAHAGQPLPDAEALSFWQDRHVVAERFARNRRRPHNRGWGDEGLARDYLHVALPPSQTLPFREICHEETGRSGVGLLECGLWTGPELFSAVLALPDALGGQERLGEVMDGLLSACQDLGGSMEYVHGAGVRLAHLMGREHAVGGFGVLRRVKAALDPSGVLNPGKLGL
jgi:FAD/FMN-containing dehydrogenase